MHQENIHNLEDSVLLLLISEGNRPAFDILYDRHFKIVYNLAYKRLNDHDQAADIVQEVFVQLWLRKSTSQIQHLPAYLFTLVRNNVFKFLEREQRYTPLPELFDHCDAAAAGADALVRHQEFVDAFDRLVNSLSPQQHIIFKMRYEQDLTTVEIAKQLDLSPKTVRNQLGKALTRLKSSLAIMCVLFFLALNR